MKSFTITYLDSKRNMRTQKDIQTDKNLVDNQLLFLLKKELGFGYYNMFVRDIRIERS